LTQSILRRDNHVLNLVQIRALECHLEIRLVTLGAGKFPDVINCSLSIESLQANPNYEGPSLPVGRYSLHRPDQIDGQQHQVTPDLETALQHLRQVYGSGVLWVDALSISQKTYLNATTKSILGVSTGGRSQAYLLRSGAPDWTSEASYQTFRDLHIRLMRLSMYSASAGRDVYVQACGAGRIALRGLTCWNHRCPERCSRIR
jgi:hypothetical protein